MRKEYKTWPEYQNANQSRRSRRRAMVKIGKGNVNAHQFLKSRAADLPKINDRITGKPMNHAANLKAVFDGKGKTGVDQYIAAVNAILMRDRGNWAQRVKGWFMVIKAKISIKWHK